MWGENRVDRLHTRQQGHGGDSVVEGAGQTDRQTGRQTETDIEKQRQMQSDFHGFDEKNEKKSDSGLVSLGT